MTPNSNPNPEVREGLELLRTREVQMMGAAISTRNWHNMETAYNAGRDRLDGLLATLHRAAAASPEPEEIEAFRRGAEVMQRTLAEALQDHLNSRAATIANGIAIPEYQA